MIKGKLLGICSVDDYGVGTSHRNAAVFESVQLRAVILWPGESSNLGTTKTNKLWRQSRRATKRIFKFVAGIPREEESLCVA